jgi:hypothetical protein
MHDIKYFFSIKIIRQSIGQKDFAGGTNYRKTLFFKIQACPPGSPLIRHWSDRSMELIGTDRSAERVGSGILDRQVLFFSKIQK